MFVSIFSHASEEQCSKRESHRQVFAFTARSYGSLKPDAKRRRLNETRVGNVFWFPYAVH